MDFVDLNYVAKYWRPKASKNYSVLLGPACSIAGGIPLSPGLLSYINKTYPQQVEHAKDRLYHSVMRALSGEQRLAVMQHFVSQAKLSWGYLALAQLIKQGLVSRVYSLNFDPLLEQACALLGVKPACYDCYLNPDLQADELADQAIIYLHGQHTTEVCPDTEEKLSQYKQMLHGLFKRDTEERTWLVLGCSGLYDPVYEVLFEIDEYPNSLYWVGRETYSGHIRAGYYSRRVGEKNYFNFINNSANVEHDLVSLSQSLNCFSPEILLFAEQANSELKRINPLRLPGQSQYLEKGLLEYGLKLNKALESHLSLVTTQLILEQELYLELLHGKYQELIDRYQATASPQNLSAKHRELLALAKFTIAMEWFLEYRLDVYIDDFERCRTILDQALALDENCYEARLKLAQLYLIKAQENKVDDERETEFETAIQHLRRIQKNIPDFWPALLCLAQLYFSRAKLAQGEQQTEDMQLSVETYRELIAMKADCAQAHAELADVFGFLAQSVSTTLQTSYFQHSARHYAQALELKDDDYEIWLKSGNLLQTWAKLEQGAKQFDLLKQSADKYGRAVAIKWDFSEAWHQWGNLLQYWASLLPEDQRQDLYEAGQSKYQLATRFNCELFDAWFAWGRLLQKWAELKPKSERIALFADAEKKFTIATRRYAEMPEAWEHWSQLLLSWSQLESGERREELIKASAEKSDRFAKAKAQLCYQSGNECGERFRLSQSETDLDMALKMYSQATVFDKDHYRAWYWGARLLATNVLRKKTELTPDLIDEVNQWFEAAIRIKPDEYDVWTKWIDFLSSLAITGNLTAVDRVNLYFLTEMKLLEAYKLNRREASEGFQRYNWKKVFLGWKNTLIENEQRELFAGLVQFLVKANRLITIEDKSAAVSWSFLVKLHLEWAKFHIGDYRLALFRDARFFMDQAIAVNRDEQTLWSEQAELLKEWAQFPDMRDQYGLVVTESEKQALYEVAIDKYTKACEYLPKSHLIWHTWACFILARARGVQGELRRTLLADAKNKFAEAERYSEGTPYFCYYNQACAAALADDFFEARRLLELAEKNRKLPTVEQMNYDNDLNSLRTQTWFVELLRRQDAGKSANS